MSKIKVTNSTTKQETSKELDAGALLVLTRTELGTFMKEDEAFLGKDDKPVTAELEKSTKLEEIEYTSDPKTPSIRIAKGEKAKAPETDPESDGDGKPDPINVAPFKEGSLTPIELPEYEWAEDKVGLVDGLKDGKPVDGDKITEMKVGQVRRLLKANRIDLNKKQYGIAAAFVDDNGLKRAAYDAVQCTQVEVKPTEAERITSYSFQYSEHVSRLHRTTTTEGNADIGVPGIFRVESSYRTARATRTDKRVVAEHKSYSHVIPKARVVFKDDKISLSDEFIRKIREAVDASRAEVRIEKLLDVLASYGQFFASDMLLGGRLDYWTDKKLEDTYTASQDENQFRLATRAKAQIEGVPVEGGANWGIGLTNEEKSVAIKQASSLYLKVVGGNEAVVSPEKWIPTVAKYLNWKVVGFYGRSLVPTIDYLDHELRGKCIKILRSYFAQHLQLRTTAIVGATHATQFGYDVGDVKRIVTINVNHGINIDGLQVTYELTNGQVKEMPWLGGRRGENNHTVGPLAFDEEISSVEVGANDLIRRLAFNTTKGRRFPESPNTYYGRGHKDDKLNYTTLEAPRVCGLVGHVGGLIDSIGLRYRELAEGKDGPKWRTFLLDVEPNLFPSNVPSMVDMTVRGILVAGQWGTEDQLNGTTTDNKRNALIVALNGHSNQSAQYFQGFRDDVLVGKGAIIVFLMRAGICDQNQLKAMSDKGHRDTVIQLVHSYTDEPLPKLQSLSDRELVGWGFAIKGGLAGAIATRSAGA